MTVTEAMAQRRSIRKFLPQEVPGSLLREIVEVSRLYPSGGNLQPIRFAILTDKALREQVFADLKWAMYLPEYTIGREEMPTAYIVLLRDDTIRKSCDYDVGAASTMVMLAAVERGLATCPIGNFSKANLSSLLELPAHLCPELVLAVGYPAQESRIVPMEDTVRYRMEEDGTFLVPKWDTEDILL